MASQNDKTPTVRFTNVRELFQAIDHVSGDFLVVTNVSPDNFTQISLSRNKSPLSHSKPSRVFRLRRYHANTGTLIITIPSHLHEALHLQIYQIYITTLTLRGIIKNWRPIDSATFRPQGHPGGDGGEGDSTGGPEPERAAKDAWPTLMIEAGDSEPLSDLRNDMRWWFSASGHQVKIIILAKFEHTHRAIILEKWEEEPRVRLGATTTGQAAASPPLQPVLKQSIAITQNTTTNPISYNVAGGGLILSFQLLFLRDPGPQEGDVVISIPDLEEYATKVWRYV